MEKTAQTEFALSQKALRTRPRAIGYLTARGVAGDIISPAAGLVDSETLHVQEGLEMVSGFLVGRGRRALRYGTSEGLVRLREKVLRRLAPVDGPPPGGFSAEGKCAKVCP